MTMLMDFEKENSALVAENYFKLAVIEKILEIMEHKGVTQSDLAKKMKLSKSQVSRLLSDDRNLTLGSIAKIFSALDEVPQILATSELDNLRQVKKDSTQGVVHLNIPYEHMPKCALTKKASRKSPLPPNKYMHIKMHQENG